MRKFFVGFLAAVAFSRCASALPCDGVNRRLTEERKEALAAEIGKQLHASNVDVLQSFQVGTWSVVYVDTHQADRAFLFYAHDPLTSHYITLWSGAGTKDEELQIKGWVLKNARGIPPKLASCFAWHVTNDRGS